MSRFLPARWLVFTVAAFLLVTALMSSVSIAPRPVSAAQNCDVPDTNLATYEQAFLGLINNYRATAGAPALTVTTPLTRAATWFAIDMSQKNYFPLDHVDLLGRDPFTRMNQCEVPGWDNAAENI